MIVSKASPQVTPPPSDVSARAVPVNSFLSELAFSKEPIEHHHEPHRSCYDDNDNNNNGYSDGKKSGIINSNSGSISRIRFRSNDNNNNNSEGMSFVSYLNGLLCFQYSSDRDLFFDAEEKPLVPEDNVDDDGKIILMKTSMSVASATSSELGGGPSVCPSIESVEIELHDGGSLRTICECRGGEQQQPHNDGGTIRRQQCQSHNPFARVHAPPAPKDVPERFLGAGKGDPIEGRRRYDATLHWRKGHNIDGILFEPHPKFELIKQHYPHYFHLRGKNGEPVFFEIPARTDLSALKAGGVTLPSLVRHYTMVTEFQWQFIETDDSAQSITVLDLDGIRLSDFVGEVVEYVKLCSKFTGQHYPERAGHVIVINVPRWFSMIFSVVKPMVDDVTLKKISIVRGKEAIFAALSEKIPVDNIPPEYGGSSMKLGDSPEEHAMRELVSHNNALSNKDFSCGGKAADPPCRLCSWMPVRRY